MAMIVQHNIAALNTNRQLGIATKELSKNTEKLSSGYRINRAADDAAGLAISEKMRSQIRGLNRASDNANDGISMIQTAEGALNESHSILQRMRELAVQAANGTETDSDRSNLQDEVEQLQEELDRIATDTEFNTMPLLDGSLAGASTGYGEAGPKFGIYDPRHQAFITSNIGEVGINTNTSAVPGGESAIWNDEGWRLTLNLAPNQTYSQAQIDNLIAEARQEDSTATNAPAQVSVKFRNGFFTATSDTEGALTEAGAKSSSGWITLPDGSFVGCNAISYSSTKYGLDMNIGIVTAFDAKKDEEHIDLTVPAIYDSDGWPTVNNIYTLHLSTGREYTESDINKLFAAEGIPVECKFQSPDPDEPSTLFASNITSTWYSPLTGGAGLGDDDAFLGQPNYDVVSGGGAGLTLQVGANEGQTMSFSIDDMTAKALGVNDGKVDVSTQKGASASIGNIDNAIAKVSKQRALLGAVQNRLEHTISNLDNTAENLQTAESSIRDVDMAKEMVQFSKNNILQQAGQSMLAQANQQTQSVLSLLGQ